ncbi:MAG TPA: hypothetical protein VNZ25_03805 [Candidatus Angelobacter sp.]|nr:hypothetical protein [Candidatus Angelobacter sp.]
MRDLRERAGPALKILCLILAALVVCQLAGILIRWNPFRGVTVPELPALAVTTNSPANRVHGTFPAASAAMQGTRLPQLPTDTNTPSSVVASNSIAPGASVSTNANAGTNVVAPAENKLIGKASTPSTVSPDLGTNQVNSTNAAGTNVASGAKPKINVANTSSVPDFARVNLNPFRPPGPGGGDLPPAIKARISRITDSEILGPVMRPLPMALLGIAGDIAFLRTASGQTGLVKAGDSLGDLKLLQIGINRVLIEQDGQKKELTIFSGYGGDSLLPKQKDNSDENNQR